VNKRKFFEFRKLLAEVSFPVSIKELLWFALAEKGDELIKIIEARPGELVISINDTYIVLYPKHELGLDVIEMANNWVEEQYVFMSMHEFRKLVSGQISGNSIETFQD
jgi:hypothetical protein